MKLSVSTLIRCNYNRMRLTGPLIAQESVNILITRDNIRLYREQLCLTWNLRLYLTGLLKRGNRPKARKISRKSACGTHRAGALTIPALNIMGRLRAFTEWQRSARETNGRRTRPERAVPEAVDERSLAGAAAMRNNNAHPVCGEAG
jgi:hypothetical protein